MSSNLACFPEDAIRMCKLSGAEVAVKENRMLTLEECEQILISAIREGEDASFWHGFWRGSELVARTLVVVADTVVAAVGVAAGPGGMLVSKSYGGVRLVVDGMSGNIDVTTGAMAIADNKMTIAGLAAEGAGNANMAKQIGIAGAILTSISSAYGQITGAAANSGGAQGIDSAVTTAKLQLQKIQRQIADLRVELKNC